MIAPGLVRTPALERVEADPELSPFLSMLDAAEVARAAVFLLSTKSRALTGEVFHVDA